MISPYDVEQGNAQRLALPAAAFRIFARIRPASGGRVQAFVSPHFILASYFQLLIAR